MRQTFVTILSGIRDCDICHKIEFLKKPRRWDKCVCCIRKELHVSGKKLAPKRIKKQCYVNFCIECSKVFESKTNSNRGMFCNKECMSMNYKKRNFEPTNKIWQNKSERTRSYYDRYSKDPVWVIKTSVRGRVKSALRNQVTRVNARYKNIEDTEHLTGCTFEFLKSHIEAQFTEGMTWSNWGEWHIDHIFPISKVDILSMDMQRLVCNYKNLQPLWKDDNLSKSNKITKTLEDIFGVQNVL